MTGEELKAEWVAAEEAAKVLGTTPLNLLMHLKRGLLTGREIDGSWFVTRASLDRLVREGKAQVVKAKCPSACKEGSSGCSCS